MESTFSINNSNNTFDAFAQDIIKGFASNPKKISSRYFYDELGDELFKEIMKLPEYYLTASETENLEIYKEEILRICCDDEPFKLIDLGSGDGTKTEILISYFERKGLPFEYIPIDISQTSVEANLRRLRSKYPRLVAQGMNYEYMEALNILMQVPARKLILFLGSNLGNFDFRDACSFLDRLRENLNHGDLLLLGLDLKKDPTTIMKAYADPKGVTAKFNYNLLERINRELDGDFDVLKFQHHVTYDPVSGELKTFLVSKEKQEVHLRAIDKCFSFDQWEGIQTECSNKYNMDSINCLAESSGFKIMKNFLDSKGYFVNSLWQKP